MTVYDGTIAAMRKNPIPDRDTQDVYVWKKADEYAMGWLNDRGYRVLYAEIEEDCIGYACQRKGVDYAVFFYAYGRRKTAMLDGEYCSRLRELKISHGKEIIVVYVRVKRTIKDNGEAEYKVGHYANADKAAEAWLLGTINGRDALIFYPNKETSERCMRFIAAYNSLNLDVLEIILDSNVYLDRFDNRYRSYNAAVYINLADIRKNRGAMKPAYIRFNDVVYSAVPYIENYGYVGLTSTDDGLIDSITVHGFDGRYRELIILDKEIVQHEKDCVPQIRDVEFLPPSEKFRFSMKLYFENGEKRRYDFSWEGGGDDVVSIGEFTFTDKIFRNGRIAEHLPMPSHRYYDDYPERGQGVLFINGCCISTVELYHYSYPVDEFDYSQYEDVFVSQYEYDADGFGIGYINNLDPADPFYLLNKNTMQAKTIPAKYQNTPIYDYPFCGGYSEGLVMVSELGEVELQYIHKRYSCAGMWGWLDRDLLVAIQPQYVFAMNFVCGRAIVCRGEWSVNEENKYWCDNEQWGVIDTKNQEVVPCRFDELYEVDGTDRLYFIHEGGWDTGHFGVFDVETQTVILELDFDFDIGYMFNECLVLDGDILVFTEHIPGEGKDFIYAYDLHESRYLIYKEENNERTFNGQKSVVVNKDGKDIIVF